MNFQVQRYMAVFFHFSQAVWRKIQNYGLTIKYIVDVNFALQVRKLIALAFIPIDKVVNYFEVLLESDIYMGNENMLTPLITYFEITCIEFWTGEVDVDNRNIQSKYGTVQNVFNLICREPIIVLRASIMHFRH